MPSFLALAVLYLAATGNCWEHISSSTLKANLQKQDDALVAFIAPDTELANALEPAWTAAKSENNSEFYSIDCIAEHQFCKDLDVFSFPAIRFFQGPEKWSRYRGERKAPAMKAFIKRARRPVVSKLNYKNVTDFHSIDDAVFIAYIPEEGDHEDLLEHFIELATQFHDAHSFGILVDKELDAPRITCYLPTEDEPRVLSKRLNPFRMKQFVYDSTEPVVGQLSVRNEFSLHRTESSLLYLFAETDEERTAFRTQMSGVAKKFREYITFLTVDPVVYDHMPAQVDLDAKKMPAAAVYNIQLGHVFPFDQSKEITPASIEQFVFDIVEGKIEPSEGMVHFEDDDDHEGGHEESKEDKKADQKEDEKADQKEDKKADQKEDKKADQKEDKKADQKKDEEEDKDKKHDEFSSKHRNTSRKTKAKEHPTPTNSHNENKHPPKTSTDTSIHQQNSGQDYGSHMNHYSEDETLIGNPSPDPNVQQWLSDQRGPPGYSTSTNSGVRSWSAPQVGQVGQAGHSQEMEGEISLDEFGSLPRDDSWVMDEDLENHSLESFHEQNPPFKTHVSLPELELKNGTSNNDLNIFHDNLEFPDEPLLAFDCDYSIEGFNLDLPSTSCPSLAPLPSHTVQSYRDHSNFSLPASTLYSPTDTTHQLLELPGLSPSALTRTSDAGTSPRTPALPHSFSESPINHLESTTDSRSPPNSSQLLSESERPALQVSRKPPRSRRKHDKQVKCTYDFCEQVFRRSCDLNKHVKTHARIFCKVVGCSDTQGFTLKKDLQRHTATIHQKTKFVCHSCGESFSRSDNHRRHFAKQHPHLAL
ncbi:hypothetical protein HYFRA_00009614 [Hymenoscyphus fraxineus]|uniref:C2H2-type domain-containing protein n=1 Tax=Hymenoscyphus fraxineus TaxID=746836 RepID=A0A9N9KS36_9HELO|nr:hypothetical protein HYFRA_00009614 [Hymenoscyphus fraxineus]